MDFCIAKKAFGQLHYEEILSGYKKPEVVWGKTYGDTDVPVGVIADKSKEKIRVHKKLIRYFISKHGNIIKKRGINNEGGTMDNYCEAPHKVYTWLKEPRLTYFNKAFKGDYNIDHKWYILQTLERIDKIEKTKKA